jgi:DNA-directed RNA polymerase sigma subunit (sigma70/sigma32)
MMQDIWKTGSVGAFPKASKPEQARVKQQLAEYHKMMQYLKDFEQYGLDRLPIAQQEQYRLYKHLTDELKRAADLILDEEERNIIAFRYLQGNRHKTTVLRYRAIMDERTVDRRLLAGIESVANTFKLWGKLE